MTDKEILAQLKKSYEYLYDIRENGCEDHCSGQLKSDLIDKIEQAKENIIDVYSSFYETLDKESLRVKSLEKNGDKVYISNDVSYDYQINDYMITCSDVDFFWYNDNDFIMEDYDVENEEIELN